MNEQSSLKGCTGVGDTFLISLGEKYITSSELPILPLCKADDYSQSKLSHIHTGFLCPGTEESKTNLHFKMGDTQSPIVKSPHTQIKNCVEEMYINKF